MNRVRNALVAVLVVGLLIAAVVRLVATNGTPEESDRAAIESLVVPGSGAIRWSPDATKIAFVVSGEIVVVRVADVRELGRAGDTIVDAGWMPDASRLVLAEGPIPTGQIVAVGPDGHVQGTTTLKPSIAFGQGLGFAINSTGTQAAVIATTREAIGGASHQDIAVIDLQRGGTKVFATPTREESDPVFVDDSTVAYAAKLPGGQLRLHTLDLVTSQVRGHGPIHDGPYAALPSDEVVVGHRGAQGAIRLDALDLEGGSRVLGVVPRHTRPVAVDRFGTRALVRRFGGLDGTRLAIEVLSK